jgi:hypothetical protein
MGGRMIVDLKNFKEYRRLSPQEKRDYAKIKHEQEMTIALRDRRTVKETASLFEAKVHADRVRLGLA